MLNVWHTDVYTFKIAVILTTPKQFTDLPIKLMKLWSTLCLV